MHQYFVAALWRGILAQLARPLLAGLAIVVLAAAAPAQAAQPCTETSARYLVRGQVERTIESNGAPLRVPAGYAVGWSCASAADAQLAFEAQAAQVGAP